MTYLTHVDKTESPNATSSADILKDTLSEWVITVFSGGFHFGWLYKLNPSIEMFHAIVK